MFYLVTGPEKSGKSARAEALAVSLGEKRIYLATMVPFGEEGTRRVEHHRSLRKDKGFITVECPCTVGELDPGRDAVVLLECVLNLTANIYFGTDQSLPHNRQETVELVCEEIVRLNGRCAHLVAVTGRMERKSGYDAETIEYIDTVDEINERLTAFAGQVIGQETENTPRFPLFVDLTGKRAYVAGAGTIGARRARVLAEFGALVLVAAPRGCSDMERMAQEGLVHWEKREFEAQDLEGAYLAVAATDRPEVNDRIAKLCRDRGILINHAGDKSQCSFYFPGIARQGEVVVGVTAGGRDHRLARQLTEALREWLNRFLNAL